MSKEYAIWVAAFAVLYLLVRFVFKKLDDE